jgi:UDP-N-acetylmuramate dehydrogenase
MDRAEFADQVAGRLGHGRLLANTPIAPFTTFRVGGPADWLLEVRAVAELQAVLRLAAQADVPVTVLGGGSNVIVSDDGVRGLVIRPLLCALEQPAPDVVRAEAGATINGLVRWTIGRGLAGLEAWAGTPGTVGGAIFGNAHWQGRDIGSQVRQVLLATPSGALESRAAAEMEFAYDTSRLQRTREILVAADFAVAAADPVALRATARQSLKYRKDTQPLASPSAGCIFQNPDPSRDPVPDGVPPSAGALVDRAGLKGRRIGGARISEAHANFIVNEGTATARDIRALVTIARETVRDRFGVLLRDEVVWLGAF